MTTPQGSEQFNFRYCYFLPGLTVLPYKAHWFMWVKNIFSIHEWFFFIIIKGTKGVSRIGIWCLWMFHRHHPTFPSFASKAVAKDRPDLQGPVCWKIYKLPRTDRQTDRLKIHSEIAWKRVNETLNRAGPETIAKSWTRRGLALRPGDHIGSQMFPPHWTCSFKIVDGTVPLYFFNPKIWFLFQFIR